MKALRVFLLVALVTLAPAIVWAADGDPGTGLKATAHDFSGQSVTGGNDETITTGLCTYCHTPHKANTGKASIIFFFENE